MTSSSLAPRLIHGEEVLALLLDAVADIPAGQKLSIPRLRDALVNQADVISGLEALIAAGKLDRNTLRPPVQVAVIPPGARKVRPYCQQPGACVAGVKGPCRLCHSKRAPVAAPAEERKPPLGDRRFREHRVTPPKRERKDDVEASVIRAEIRAFLERSGMTKSRFGREAMADPKFVPHLDDRTLVRGKSAERIRAFIANYQPTSATERSEAAALPRTKEPAVLPPPPAPAAPRGERQAAAARKTARREAERILERDPDATKGRNGGVTAAINQLKFQKATVERLGDPVEQAKLALQRKGRVVYSAIVHGGRKDRYIVGGQRDRRTGRLKEHTPAELIDLAEQVTGQSFRRVA